MNRINTRLTAYWTTTILLAFIMFSGAIGELTHQWGTPETHMILGYPLYVLTIIGAWKILGTLAILVPRFPRLKGWAYAGMFINMTGAFASHTFVRDYGAGGYHLIATGSIALLVLASWALRPQDRTLGVILSSKVAVRTRGPVGASSHA